MERNHYFDFLRGIAIIMVIGIHTCGKCGLGNWQEISSLVTREFINVAVPLFLTLSAFFLSRKTLNSKDDCIRFWKKQIPKVYLPCFFWSLPLFVIGLMNGKSVVNQSFLLFTGGYSIYYFIPLIIQCYLLLPLFLKCSNSVLGGGGLIVSMCSAYLISYCGGYGYPFLVYMAPVTTWILFFALGIILGRSERNHKISALVACVILSLALQIVESLYQKSIGVSCPFDCTKPSGFIYSAILILLLFSKQIEIWYAGHRSKVVEYIGEISFTLYLGHCYIIIEPDSSNFSVPYVVKWFAVLVVSTTCVYTLRRIITNKRIRYFIGL